MLLRTAWFNMDRQSWLRLDHLVESQFTSRLNLWRFKRWSSRLQCSKFQLVYHLWNGIFGTFHLQNNVAGCYEYISAAPCNRYISRYILKTTVLFESLTCTENLKGIRRHVCCRVNLCLAFNFSWTYTG